jgi:hypothetical protein
MGKKYEVTGDGRTVWVNSKERCIGRFCPVSYEIFFEHGQTTHMNNNPVKDWERFVDEMGKYHHVIFDDECRPEFTKP